MEVIAPAVAARFWAKVQKTEGCWLFTGYRDRDGYGRFSLPRVAQRKRRTVRASRLAFFLTNGRWPAAEAAHSCDNPPCVRPDHLEDATHQANIADRDQKGRAATGARNGRSKLTAVRVAELREALRGGEPLRRAARRFGLHHKTASDIRDGVLWPDVEAAGRR